MVFGLGGNTVILCTTIKHANESEQIVGGGRSGATVRSVHRLNAEPDAWSRTDPGVDIDFAPDSLLGRGEQRLWECSGLEGIVQLVPGERRAPHDGAEGQTAFFGRGRHG